MKKLILSIITIAIAGVVAIAPAFAEGEKCTLTSVLANSYCQENAEKKGDLPKKDPTTGEELSLSEDEFYCFCSTNKGDGAAIKDVLDIAINIMSIGVGILGVVGITITGIQYLTAGGSEDKAKKAKRRLFEIILGLIAYVLIYAALQWLIPSFPNNQ